MWRTFNKLQYIFISLMINICKAQGFPQSVSLFTWHPLSGPCEAVHFCQASVQRFMLKQASYFMQCNNVESRPIDRPDNLNSDLLMASVWSQHKPISISIKIWPKLIKWTKWFVGNIQDLTQLHIFIFLISHVCHQHWYNRSFLSFISCDSYSQNFRFDRYMDVNYTITTT
jgi:hypothetical protein